MGEKSPLEKGQDLGKETKNWTKSVDEKGEKGGGGSDVSCVSTAAPKKRSVKIKRGGERDTKNQVALLKKKKVRKTVVWREGRHSHM